MKGASCRNGRCGEGLVRCGKVPGTTTRKCRWKYLAPLLEITWHRYEKVSAEGRWTTSTVLTSDAGAGICARDRGSTTPREDCRRGEGFPASRGPIG